VHDIYILTVDGSRETRAVQSPANDVMVGWAPDGKTLLFSSDRTGSPGLWSIAIAEGKPIGQPALLKKDIGRITPLGLSSQGTLYYGMQSGVRDVYTASIDPKTLKPVSEPVLAAQRFLGTNAGADWSPDGKYLVFASTRGLASRGPSVLTFHSLADGTERDVLPKLASINGDIRWSPDGGSVLIRGIDRKGQQGLYNVDAMTGATILVATGRSSLPVWSPDGGTMYYGLMAAPPSNVARVIALDARTGTERKVYQVPSGVLQGFPIAISPDGKSLAIGEAADSHSKIEHYLEVPFDRGKPRILVEFSPMRAYVGLTWTRDGESLVFAKPGQNDQGVDLWRVGVHTGEQALVGKYPTGGFTSFRISPDRRQMSYTHGGATAEVWTLENFLSEVKGK
jgi:Tol biopolymer transport system component